MSSSIPVKLCRDRFPIVVVLFVCIILTIIFSSIATAGQGVKGKKLKNLFSGNTLTGKNIVKDFGLKEYYDKDGSTVDVLRIFLEDYFLQSRQLYS